MTNYREILRLNEQGISQRSIAVSCGCSKTTVNEVLRNAKELGLSFGQAAQMSDLQLERKLFPQRDASVLHKMPDYEQIHREMAKSGVTLSLLWNEYCENSRLNKEIPFMYTQFCKHYRDYAGTTKATMHISHKPGEQMEVDWAGQTAGIIDTDTGEIIPAYVYVAVLSSSGYAYVEAFLSQDQGSWITAHVNAYRFFGGVTRILISDNLKTGVEKPGWYTPIINRIYHEMAEHYGTAVIPARVRKPKDKPMVEGTVGVVSTWVIAALRNQQFFSVSELNAAIREKLDEFNHKPFQKKAGSRYSVFMEEEKGYLLPLPKASYELAEWKIATVQYNYHIAVEKMNYSVPYEYIRQKVDVRLTRNVIEVFFQGGRICSHPRLYGTPGQYATVVGHMPENHRQYTQWNGERFISWAGSIGFNTESVVRGILSSHRIEQQGYRACMALLKLADKYSLERLETACERALSYTPRPGYKSIQTILQTGQDKLPADRGSGKPSSLEKNNSSEFGYTRGAAYYGRNAK